MEAPVISLKWMESPFIRWNWMKSPFIPYTIVTGMEQREFKKDTLIWNGIQWFKESCYGMILNNKSILWQSKNIVIEHKKKRLAFFSNWVHVVIKRNIDMKWIQWAVKKQLLWNDFNNSSIGHKRKHWYQIETNWHKNLRYWHSFHIEFTL